MEGMNPREGGVVPAPRKYPIELRERAQRPVAEPTAEDPILFLNAAVLGSVRVGVNPDTLRGWHPSPVRLRRFRSGSPFDARPSRC